jgi:hypothetical protein
MSKYLCFSITAVACCVVDQARINPDQRPRGKKNKKKRVVESGLVVLYYITNHVYNVSNATPASKKRHRFCGLILICPRHKKHSRNLNRKKMHHKATPFVKVVFCNLLCVFHVKERVIQRVIQYICSEQSSTPMYSSYTPDCRSE